MTTSGTSTTPEHDDHHADDEEVPAEIEVAGPIGSPPQADSRRWPVDRPVR